MKTFFEILFKKLKPVKNEKFNVLTFNTDDLIDGFVEAGFYKYQDCCGVIHFHNKPFTKRQIKKIEKEATEVLYKMTNDLTYEINKQILNDMMANGMLSYGI